MSKLLIQQIWKHSYEAYTSSEHFQSDIQRKVSRAILNCKSGKLGINISQCPDCGHMEFHNNSCSNRNCPNCQNIHKEIWVDKRRAEVIDAPYFHVIFTLPHELNPLLYGNQQLLMGSSTDAVPRHSWSCLPIRSISGQHPALSRYSIPGTRRWATMCICTASFPEEGLLRTEKFGKPKTASLSL